MSTFWIEKEDNIPNGYKLTNEVTYNILSPGEGVTGFITRLTNSHKPPEDQCDCEEGMG